MPHFIVYLIAFSRFVKQALPSVFGLYFLVFEVVWFIISSVVSTVSVVYLKESSMA